MTTRMAVAHWLVLFVTVIMVINARDANGTLPAATLKAIAKANGNGPYIGIVILNIYEINAAITTQLLLSFFDVEGVIHYGIAGNANPALHVSETSLLPSIGRIRVFGMAEIWARSTRKLGHSRFANYTINVTACASHNNLLNNIWYQPEEVFPVTGTPEGRQHQFWVPVGSAYFAMAKKLEGLKLKTCVNVTTCLNYTPSVSTVKRGVSAGVYLDNVTYRSFIYGKFNASPVDMESTSVALICYQQNTSFIAIRALSDLAGGGSTELNEADTFSDLAADNAVTAVVEFIKQLSSSML